MTTSLQNNNTLSLPLITVAAEGPKVESEQTSPPSTTAALCLDAILSMALPLLLRVQFSMTLSHQMMTAASSFEELPINGAVAASFLSSLLYRKLVLASSQRHNQFIFLLPEVITLISILLLSCDRVLMGYLCLISGSAVMACTVTWSAFLSLMADSSKSSILQFCITLALPCFIFAEYYVSFSAGGTDMQGLTPSVANYANVIFLFATVMYRQVLRDEQVQSFLFHLLPETVAISTIVLTVCGQVMAGFMCLLLGECVLALTGAVFCSRSLWAAYRQLQSAEEGSATETLSAPLLEEAVIV